MLVPENVELNSERVSELSSGSFSEYAYNSFSEYTYKLMGRAPFDAAACFKLFAAHISIRYALACSRAGYNADETVRLWRDGVLEEYL